MDSKSNIDMIAFRKIVFCISPPSISTRMAAIKKRQWCRARVCRYQMPDNRITKKKPNRKASQGKIAGVSDKKVVRDGRWGWRG
jgi:hypothetical protein